MAYKINKAAQSGSRLENLEGLRGVAAVIVVAYHFILMFYPSMFYGIHPVLAPVQNMRLEDNIYGNPLNVFLSGGFAVGIFFVLSGFVLSVGFFQSGENSIIRKLALKRYLRLMLPALASILIAFLILWLGLASYKPEATLLVHAGWLGVNWQIVPDFFNALWQGLYGVFFAGDVTYNPVLWTMKYEFLGSFLVFIVLALFGKSRRRGILYALLILFFFNSWYLGFVLGLVLADVFVQNKPKFKYVNQYAFAGLIVGLFVGAYPVISAVGTIYEYIKFPFLNDDANFSSHVLIGATLVIFAVLTIPKLSRFFEHPKVSWLSKYTFSLYLVHLPIIFSLTTFLFVTLHQIIGFNKAALLSCVLTLPVIAAVTWLFERYIDSPAIKLSSRFARWFEANDDKPKRVKSNN